MIEVAIKKRIKRYKGFEYLEVNHSFQAGAITQISGPSGAGKTTLLKIIAGLTEPEEGRITVNGDIWLDTSLKINRPSQYRYIGFVFQDYALFPNMTVEEHLRFGTRDEIYIQRLIALGQLDPFRTHKPKHLSGGQQQRLAILRALSTKPKVLLMDEPFSALNRSLMEEMMKELKVLFQETGVTCLIVSHQQGNGDLFSDFNYSIESQY